MVQRFLSMKQLFKKDEICKSDLIPYEFYTEADNLNAIISEYVPHEGTNNDYLQFIGNGYFGIVLDSIQSLYIKHGRILSMSVPFNPVVEAQLIGSYVERKVLNYKDGIAYLFGCYNGKLRITYKYYAHRTLSSLFVQEIEVQNLFYNRLSVDFVQKEGDSTWISAFIRQVKIKHPDTRQERDYSVITRVILDAATGKSYMFCIVTPKFPMKINVRKFSALVRYSLNKGPIWVFYIPDKVAAYKTQTVTILTSVRYVAYVRKGSDDTNKRQILENDAIENLKSGLQTSYKQLQQDHIDNWHRLWKTGISVSNSKAQGTFNGDLINATMYYVLSSVPSLYRDKSVNFDRKNLLVNNLSTYEGCYGSHHHTLQAENLWSRLLTVSDVNNTVDLWLLTLEKQGCYDLVKSGAEGVVQAMVLSFGSFQFTKHHLSFNMHPEFLHRNYYFRNISYGNGMHVHLYVEVQEDNKAAIFVAAEIDGRDNSLYACDGGCLDEPVQLGPARKELPVKLTTPFTAILYITPDKQHLNDLKHTLHVKNVVEAPAQEHKMMILHRHGHHLRGLPTFFWIAICTLIIIFHLFLIKLICSEYKNPYSFIPSIEHDLAFTCLPENATKLRDDSRAVGSDIFW